MNTGEILLDRDTYRKIKAKNKDEMTEFITSMYNSGRKSAFEEFDRETLKAEIGAVKGIGEVKLAEIMGIIEKAFGAAEKEK